MIGGGYRMIRIKERIFRREKRGYSICNVAQTTKFIYHGQIVYCNESWNTEVVCVYIQLKNFVNFTFHNIYIYKTLKK